MFEIQREAIRFGKVLKPGALCIYLFFSCTKNETNRNLFFDCQIIITITPYFMMESCLSLLPTVT